MTAKSSAVITMMAVGLGVMTWQLTQARAASSTELASVRNMVAPVVLTGDDDHAYVGSKTCKKCHFKEHKSWAKTPHAEALESLKPGNAADAKKAHGLDPDKDYTTDEKCMKCHVTGLGHKGGYAIGGDEKEMKDLAGVGCEMCHGAGEKYSEFHEQIMKEKKNYTEAEMEAVGMHKVSADTCKTCHNDQSPTFDPSKPFDYEAKVKEGVHENFELKYKTE